MRCGAMAEEENVRGADTRNVLSGLTVGRRYSMRARSRNGAWCGAVMVACRRSGAAAAMARQEYSDMDIGCGFPWSSTRLPFLRRPCLVHPTQHAPAARRGLSPPRNISGHVKRARIAHIEPQFTASKHFP